jgi:nitrogen fixation protein NifB
LDTAISEKGVLMKRIVDISDHPCFNLAASHGCGRIHLPVAPNCNILCNFCRRDYDCLNESRPGVTGKLLSPRQAVEYLDKVMEVEPDLTVAGIAGPGDALANPRESLATLRLVRQKYPALLLCLATNGLAAPDYLDEIAEAGVTHVSVTVNAVDPFVGAGIYRWVKNGNLILRGVEAAAFLWDRQVKTIEGLKKRGIIVKVNTIVISGLNDGHVLDVSRQLAELGVDIQNCMALLPTAGTPLADTPEPPASFMEKLRKSASAYLPQMTHCRRCRADAVGKLHKDRSAELKGLMDITAEGETRPYVAVASLEGMLVNLHLGQAPSLQIWKKDGTGFSLLEEREMPGPGNGDLRWKKMSGTLSDCRAVLTSAAGDRPKRVLEETGMKVVEMDGLIEEGLSAVYEGRDMRNPMRRKNGRAKMCCRGGGEGC